MPEAVSSKAEIALQEALLRRRQAVSALWNLSREVVLIGAGQPVPVPGRGDLTYPFRSHSEYFYLTDRERPGSVLAFDPQSGWVDFVPAVTQAERVWEGGAEIQEGVPVAELEGWLEQRRGRPRAGLGCPVPQVTPNPSLEAELRAGLNQIRRVKDAIELDRMRTAEAATRAGFAAVSHLLVPGTLEREVAIALEAAFRRAGAEHLAFDTIVGGGPNSAVLHFPPTSRPFAAGELVLVDAGGEYRGYASDVTRTYPVSGHFKPEQAELYALVRQVNRAGVERCQAGTEWRDIHIAAATEIAQGLVDFGLLRGQAESLVEQDAHRLFFPHGIGHMVGLGVRDAGEVLPGREGRSKAGHLRLDLPLEPGHVVTVEPGIYFIPALLQDPEQRQRHQGAVDWERADRMLNFGGIRIEHNVLVTEDGFEVLTSDIPLAE